MIGAVKKWITRPKRMSAGDAPRILVTRLDGIGDFVMLTPFLRELRRNYPESRITLVTGRNAAPIAETCPYVDEVLFLDSPPARRSFPSYLQYAAALMRYLDRLDTFAKSHLQGRVDLAIQPRWDVDLHWATLVTLLSGAPKRVGYAERATPMKAWCNFGHDRCFSNVLPAGPEQHEVERNLDVIRHLGGKVAAVDMELWTRPEDKTAAVRFLEENGRDVLPVIAFAVGGTNPRHHWPHYAELIQLLSREIEFLPVIIAGPGEESAIHEIRRVCPHAAGTRSLPLRVVVAVISECALFIGNDTGPKHLAAAAGVPVIEISSHSAGSTRGYDGDPDRFGPRVPAKDVIRPAVALPGCELGCISGMPHCISTITAQEVAGRTITLLSTVETCRLEMSH
jgi:heptosyltransferase-2